MIIEQIIKQGATLIDVREEIELIMDGSVEGAVHIPLSEIQQREEEIGQMQKPIVVFCKAGGRAGQAVDYLSSKGIEEIYNGGGFKDVNKILLE